MKAMSKTTLLTVLALLSCFCGCLLDTGGGSGEGCLRIEGYVKDGPGKPVSDVTVKAYLVFADA